MKVLSNRVGVIALVMASGFGPLAAAELQPAASSAWEAYVARADQQMRARVASAGPFLWVDEAPSRNWSVQDGAILVGLGMGSGTEAVPGGMIHHWLAAACCSKATWFGRRAVDSSARTANAKSTVTINLHVRHIAAVSLHIMGWRTNRFRAFPLSIRDTSVRSGLRHRVHHPLQVL